MKSNKKIMNANANTNRSNSKGSTLNEFQLNDFRGPTSYFYCRTTKKGDSK